MTAMNPVGTSCNKLFYGCVVIMLIMFMQPVAARMYQWTDPVSGRTQLSGNPPAWYRSGGDNPRVFVFEKGQLIDDTGVAVEEAQRRRLRQEALVGAEESAAAAKRKAEQSALLRSRTENSQVEVPVIPESETTARPEDGVEQDPAVAPETPELTEEQIAELRTLISIWEARNQNRARELIGSGNAPDMDAESRETLRQFLEQNSE